MHSECVTIPLGCVVLVELKEVRTMIEHFWKLGPRDGDPSVPLYRIHHRGCFVVKAQDLGKVIGLSPRDSRRVVQAIRPTCSVWSIFEWNLDEASRYQLATVLTGEAVVMFLARAKGKGLNTENLRYAEYELTPNNSEVVGTFGLNLLPRDTRRDIRIS